MKFLVNAMVPIHARVENYIRSDSAASLAKILSICSYSAIRTRNSRFFVQKTKVPVSTGSLPGLQNPKEGGKVIQSDQRFRRARTPVLYHLEHAVVVWKKDLRLQ